MRLLRVAFVISYASSNPKVPDVSKYVPTTEKGEVPGGESEPLEITPAEDRTSAVEEMNLLWVVCFPD